MIVIFLQVSDFEGWNHFGLWLRNLEHVILVKYSYLLRIFLLAQAFVRKGCNQLQQDNFIALKLHARPDFLEVIKSVLGAKQQRQAKKTSLRVL